MKFFVSHKNYVLLIIYTLCKLNKLYSITICKEKKLKKFLILTLFVFTVILSSTVQLVYAGDIAAGEQIFSANCAACHGNGNNVIATEKTLKKDALEENGMNSQDAIMTQVKNGKNAMPAFGGRLADEDIDNVASYVLSQSEKGW